MIGTLSALCTFPDTSSVSLQKKVVVHFVTCSDTASFVIGYVTALDGGMITQ